ncbi:MAG: M23 family metallopeptidase [Actinomycetota bacterium]
MALLALPPAAAAAPCWLPPVPGEVIDPFREPPCPYCAGNRGIEYRVAAGTAVRAVATGVVTFSGPVAGVGYVVVRHGDGRRITYGRLAARTVDRGDRVIARMVVGRTTDRFHLGVRVGERYVDPAPMLGRLVGRPRLVPVDGTAARRPPPPRLRCGVGSAGSSR